MQELESATSPLKLIVQLDRMAEIVHLAIRRASVFTRIAEVAPFDADGINNADEGEFFRVSLFGKATDERLEEYKRNYTSWVRLNAVCEVMEGFYVFVDEVLIALKLLREQLDHQLTYDEYQQIAESVRNRRVKFSDKIKAIQADYSVDISQEHKQYIDFVEQIRHCASHSRGIVDPRHFTHKGKNGTARLEWLTMSAEAVLDDGVRQKLTKPTTMRAGGLMGVKIEKWVKEVKYGSYLELSFREVELIGLTMTFVVKSIQNQVAQIMATMREPADEEPAA